MALCQVLVDLRSPRLPADLLLGEFTDELGGCAGKERSRRNLRAFLDEGQGADAEDEDAGRLEQPRRSAEKFGIVRREIRYKGIARR